jgi:uncharacterized Fe-S cluster protein YjdI
MPIVIMVASFQMRIMTEKKYTNGEITVVWRPEVCQHSSRCWKGLISVFDPRKKPWINITGDTSESIVEQVKKCPSGALIYFENSTTKAKSQSPSG